MKFDLNSPFLYALTIIVLTFVTGSCIFFMVRSYREGIRRGMDKAKLKKVITSSAIFSIGPSLAILITVLTLAGNMGIPFPWLRLSVIGAITYEVPAAQTAAAAIMGENATIAAAAATPVGFATIAYAMTFGIIAGIPFIPFLVPKIRNSMTKIKEKDEKWSKLLTDALFLGLISAFVGVAISGVTTNRVTNETIPFTTGSRLVSILTFLSGIAITGIFGLLIKKFKWSWLEAYVIPATMLIAMGLAIVFNAVLPANLFM